MSKPNEYAPLVALCGPSGVGKGIMKRHIKEEFPDFIEPRVISTRPPRADDGQDRLCVDLDNFLQ